MTTTSAVEEKALLGNVVVLCILDDPELEQLQAAFNACNRCAKVDSAPRPLESAYHVQTAGPSPLHVTLASVNRRGNIHAAIKAMELLQRLTPRLFILYGIAGSMVPKKVIRGDVVIQDSVYVHAYTKIEQGKQARSETFPAPDVPRLAPYSRLFRMKRKDVFVPDGLLQPDPNAVNAMAKNERSAKVMIGKFLVSDYTLDCSVTRDEHTKNDREIVAIEMESYGILLAAHSFRNGDVSGDPFPLDVVVIRGISDLAAQKAESDNIEEQEGVDWRVYAARNAASTVLEYICGLTPDAYKLK